jgi:hypothetical protein
MLLKARLILANNSERRRRDLVEDLSLPSTEMHMVYLEVGMLSGKR